MTEFFKYCREYFDQSPYGQFIFNKKGKILEINPETCRITGLSREKILGKDFSYFFSEEPDRNFPDYYNSLLEDDYANRIIKYNKPGCDLCYLRLDSVKVKENKYLAFVIDVTAEVNTDNDLKSRLKLEQIISSFSLSLTVVDSENISEVVDKAFEKLGMETGVDRVYFFIYSDDLVYFSNIYEWCSEGTPSGIDDLQNIKSENYPWWTFKMKSDQPIIFENINDLPEEATAEKVVIKEQSMKSAAIIPSFYDGSLKGFFGFDSVKKSRKWSEEDLHLLRMAGDSLCNSVIRIKKQEEREKLEEKINSIQRLDSIGKLAGGIAHDFNNIMQIITGYTELAAGADFETIQKCLVEIKAASEKASDLTADLLAFARKQHAAPRSVDFNTAVSKAVKLLKRLVPPEVKVVFKPGKDLWPVVIDPTQVDQVVANLILNSIDSIDGKGSVIIETYNAVVDKEHTEKHPYFAAGEFAVLAVSDTGCGMDDEIKAHIFEPFYTTKGISGAGLGLSTVYGIVKQNEGYVIVYSETGIGTTFKVYFRKGDIPLEDEPDVQRESRESESDNKNILVVEDEESILNLISRVLEKDGYNVITAENGQEAIDGIIKNSYSFDLLITDVVMPEMNGRELNEKIREYCPEIKIIFMSGYTANIIADSGILDEGINFLQKPFSVQQLKDKVHEILEGRDK